MAVTDPQAIKFCNEQVRPAADRYIQLYWFAKTVNQSWVGGGMSALIPNTADPIDDGGDTDGRGIITGAMVNGMMTNLQLMIADLEANTNAKLNGLTKIAVNEIPR